MATHFERQLEELHEEMITMGSLCEKVITLAAKAIEGENTIQDIFLTDKEIDAKEREIEHHCMRLLLHQQPVARDLREVSAALKMISDMERIGDQARDIADLAKYIENVNVKTPKEIQEMASVAVKMVTGSVDAFVKKDLDLCRKVIEKDDVIDDAFNEVKDELAELIHHDLEAKAGLDLLMTAKYIERIGDHAVNIAEWVEFSITGTHRNSETEGAQ